jgi:hypothetical protein
MEVADLAARCLALAEFLPTDTNLPVGAKAHILDAIMGGVDDMAREAPGLFEKSAGGVIVAPFTYSAAFDSANPNRLPLPVGYDGTPEWGTIRIPGMACDAERTDEDGTYLYFAPSCELASATVSATIYGDVVSLGGETAKRAFFVNGHFVEPVASREAAESRWGYQSDGARSTTQSNGWPAFWWTERSACDSNELIGMYPMPAVNWRARTIPGLESVREADVLTSAATFHIDDSMARDIWRPLVMQRITSAPWVKNESKSAEIGRQAQAALTTLRRMMPKTRRQFAFNDFPAPGAGYGRPRDYNTRR